MEMEMESKLMICQGEILSFYCRHRHRHKANVTSSDQFLVDSLPVQLNNGRLVLLFNFLHRSGFPNIPEIVCVCVFVLDNNMINIKINTLRVKVIAFGAQSIIILIIGEGEKWR